MEKQKKNQTTKNIILIVFILLCLWVFGLFMFVAEIPIQKKYKDKVRTDAIIVLTGGSGRLTSALALLKEGAANLLFISGVYRGLDVRHLLLLMREEGVGIEDRIKIGNAVDTIENANESAEWVKQNDLKSIRLVTSSYHMPRSLLEFKNILPSMTKIVPHPVFPKHVKQEEWWAWPGTALLLISEYNKIMLSWLRLQIQTAFS